MVSGEQGKCRDLGREYAGEGLGEGRQSACTRCAGWRCWLDMVGVWGSWQAHLSSAGLGEGVPRGGH